MDEGTQLTLVLGKVGILLEEVIEEGVVAKQRLLHLSPVATRGVALLQMACDTSLLVTHLTDIGCRHRGI